MLTAVKQLTTERLQSLEEKHTIVKPANTHREQKQTVALRSLCKNSLLIRLEDSDGGRDRRRQFGAVVFVIFTCARSDSVGIEHIAAIR